MKKLYRFLNDHIIGVIRVLMVMLLPCAFSRHFATWFMVFSYLIRLILYVGNGKGWDKEE